MSLLALVGGFHSLVFLMCGKLLKQKCSCLNFGLNIVLVYVRFLGKKKESYFCNSLIFCDPGGIRTHGPLIKSQLLYQLSYGVFLLVRLVTVLRVQICDYIFISARKMRFIVERFFCLLNVSVLRDRGGGADKKNGGRVGASPGIEAGGDYSLIL